MSHILKMAATAALLVSSGVVTSAQVVRPVAPGALSSTVTSSAARSTARNDQGMIHGTAFDPDSRPLPNVPVRLRNLATAEIEKVSNTNQVGEFTFIVKPEIPYVVEIADRAGQILAVGNIVSVQAGEVAGVIVQVPVRLPALLGLLGNTAGSVVSAASGAGITALQATVQPPPASPEN